MKTGLDSYDFGQKNTWRGTQWNYIVDLLIRSERSRQGEKWSHLTAGDKRRMMSNKNVVYLCGPDDIDRKHALRRGFRSENLTAVDINGDNIRSVRRCSRGIAIEGRLEGVVANYSGHIDVVIADTCSSFNNAAIDLLSSFNSSDAINGETAICVNLKRGRDAETNSLREYIASLPEKIPSYLAHLHADLPKTLRKFPLHRGLHFFMAGLISAELELSSIDSNIEDAIVLLESSFKVSAPMISTYRSGVNVMDSVTYLGCFHSRIIPNNYQPTLKQNISDATNYRGKLAAAKALRTMKAAGTLAV